MPRRLLLGPKWILQKGERVPSARLGNFALGALLVMAAMLAISGWMTFRTSSERRTAESHAEHTREILRQTAELRLATQDTLRGERGYLLTHDREFLDPYTRGIERITVSFDALTRAITDNHDQQLRLAEVQRRIAFHLATMQSLIRLEESNRHAEALSRIRAGEGRNSIESIFASLSAFESRELALLAARQVHAQKIAQREVWFEYLLAAVGALLLTTGVFAGLALRRSLERQARVEEELRRAATTDDLTGLANRFELLRSLDRMIASADRTGRPLSLAILDIDRFKRVNDTWGHPAGDEVIRHVAEMAMHVVRNQDLVERLGGEEFVIAFPDCDIDAAFRVCERLREAIATLPVILPGGIALQITLSSGVASWRRPHHPDRACRRGALRGQGRRSRPGAAGSLTPARRCNSSGANETHETQWCRDKIIRVGLASEKPSSSPYMAASLSAHRSCRKVPMQGFA